MTVYDIRDLRRAVCARLPARRLHHVLGVEEQICRLSDLVWPEEKLRLQAAALLHDITKDIPDSDQPALCDALGIPLSSAQRAVPPVLHALTAPVVAARDFAAYVDPQILSAIRAHTTGEVGMDLFGRLLMMADFSEAGREWDRCRAVRERISAVSPRLPLPQRRQMLDRIFLYMLRVKYDYIATTGAEWNEETKALLTYWDGRFGSL